jgi:hypothetical protein
MRARPSLRRQLNPARGLMTDRPPCRDAIAEVAATPTSTAPERLQGVRFICRTKGAPFNEQGKKIEARKRDTSTV